MWSILYKIEKHQAQDNLNACMHIVHFNMSLYLLATEMPQMTF